MQAAPLRLINALFWPLAVWGSLGQFGKHDADDYVERTFPIVATAIAFWVCVALLVFTMVQGGGVVFGDGDGGESMAARLTPGWVDSVSGVLWFFLPALYLIGFWLFTAREERFPR